MVLLRLLLLILGVFLVLFVLRALRARIASLAEPANGPARMSRAEALDVLNLEEGASQTEIEQAYRALMKKVHPDTAGGSTYLAAKVNQAKRVLRDA